jgi:hypothetical protein
MTTKPLSLLVVVGLVAAACLDLPEVEYPNPVADGGTRPEPDAGRPDSGVPDSGTPPDTVAPNILGTVPADGATQVGTATRLEVSFSEPMKTSSVRVTLQPAVSLGVPAWSAGNSRLVVQPATTLAQSTNYTVTVEGQDEAGNGLAVRRSFTFRTEGPEPDTIQPTAISYSPSNAATGVERSGSIIVLFSEPMNKTSAENAFQIVSPLGFNAGTFTWNSAATEMTFKPSTDFSYGADVQWRVSTAARDVAGNALGTQVTGTFRVLRQFTVTIDFDPGTSGSLGRPYYFRQSSIYNVASVGDATDDTTHRLFFGFKLDSISESLIRITQCSLKWWITGQQGNPFGKFGNLFLERVNIGDKLDGSGIDGTVNPLAVEDYYTNALGTPILVPINISATHDTFNITHHFIRDWTERNTRGRRSQYRLRFEGESDLNGSSDRLFSTAETQPKLAELRVTYEAP